MTPPPPQAALAVRVATASTRLFLLCLLGWIALGWRAIERPAPPPPPAPESTAPQLPPEWMPPGWFPASGDLPLLGVLPELDAPARPVRGAAAPPRTRARAVILADLDQGRVLHARGADDPWPVASVTKLVSSLAFASTGASLDRQTCITHEQWPTRPGARSKYDTGTCTVGWDYLGSALVASDNRGAMALPPLADLRYPDFVDRMHEVSADLGMWSSRWADPAGIEDGNLSTARDVLKATVAVAAHPILSRIASAPEWRVHTMRGPRTLHSTNRLVRRADLQTLAAKTGYTDTARWCFSTVVRTKSGRLLGVAVLGARSRSARFAEARRLIEWADGLPTPSG